MERIAGNWRLGLNGRRLFTTDRIVRSFNSNKRIGLGPRPVTDQFRDLCIYDAGLFMETSVNTVLETGNAVKLCKFARITHISSNGQLHSRREIWNLRSPLPHQWVWEF